MGCWEHNKEFVGNCTWCGKQLCTICIAKEDGKKIYCRKCLGSLSQVKPFEKPRPLVREVEDTAPNRPQRVVRKTGSEAYELDKGYVLKRPTPVDKPKSIERALPSESETSFTPKQNSASRNAMSFLEMQHTFDKKKPEQPKPIQRQESRQPTQSSMSKSTISKVTESALKESAQKSPQQSRSFSKPNELGESTSRQAAQSALHFLAQQAKHTEDRSKK
jgi:hypothetical protein